MNFHDLQHDFENQHLLVIGDVMVDRYIVGTIDRISPEAPVPVLHQSRLYNRLGGAGNVVHAVKALGGQVSFISTVGQDTEATWLNDTLKPLTRYCHLIQDDKPTSLKMRYMAQNQQLLRVDREDKKSISDFTAHKILKYAEDLAPTLGGVILSDYDKGVLTPSLISHLIELYKTYNIPVFIDPKVRDFEKYRGADWLTPNRKELSSTMGRDIFDDKDIEKACLDLINRYNVKGILATRSEHGMSIILPHEQYHLPAKVLDVFDVSGAGDTVIGTFALAVAAGFDPLASADLSNHAAGVVVSKSGTATVSLQELYQHKTSAVNDSKYCTLALCQERLFEWHRHHLTVGFTNGCFDILHPGHLNLLKEAKSHCDRLIVGINSDASIKRLKGPERPIHDLQHRVRMLEALPFVDMVIEFHEDTPLNLISVIKPDILFKGSDYTLDRVVGAKEVMSWGGRVELLQLVEGHSTTLTVNKIKKYTS